MTPATAQAIADTFECLLTTRKMCDDIYVQATVKLAPSPINPQTTDITLVTTTDSDDEARELLRLERLLDFPCSASLWVPVAVVTATPYAVHSSLPSSSSR